MNSSISRRSGSWHDTGKNSTISKVHRCSVCDKIYSRPDHLRRHFRVHSCGRDYSCRLCDRSFTRQDLLRRHLVHVHHASSNLDPAASQSSPESAANGPETNPRRSSKSNNQTQAVHVSTIDSGYEGTTALSQGHDPGILDSSIMRETFRLVPSPIEDLLSPGDPPNTREPTNSVDSANTGNSSNPSFPIGVTLDDLWSLHDVYRCQASPMYPVQQGITPNINETSPRSSSYLNVGRKATVPEKSISENGASNRAFRWPNESITPLIHEGLFMIDTAPSRGPQSLDQSLRQIDAERLYNLFKTKVAPHKPFLHFPTLALQRSIELDQATGCPRCRTHSRQLRKDRIIPPHLLFMILALAAAYDLQPSLAHVLFTKSGSLITEKLHELRSQDVYEPPQNLIQALMLYITFGMSFGERICTESMTSHLYSLRALVRAAKLSEPASSSPCTDPNCQVEGNDLDRSWLHWVAMEERRRTFYIYLYNSSAIHAYIDLDLDINIDHIDLQLPASEALWAAETSLEWAAVQSRGTEHPTSFAFQWKHILEEHGSESLAEKTGGVNELGCVVLIAALSLSVCNMKRTGATILPSISNALKRWQSLWLSTSQSNGADVNKQLMADSLPVLNYLQLTLCDIDLSEVKNALLSRSYDEICAAYSRVGQNNTSDPHLTDIAAGDGPWANEQRNLRSAALYATNALKMTLQHGITWCSDNVVDMASSNVATTFHCAQIIVTWLEAASKRQQGNSLYYYCGGTEFDDSLLLGAISNLADEFQQQLGIMKGNKIGDCTFTASAVILLEALAGLFDRVIMWPVFKVFAHCLRVRRDAIVANSPASPRWLQRAETLP